MKKLLAAIAAFLLASPMSAHAAYYLSDHYVALPGRGDSRWSCADALYREPNLKIAITHYDSLTRASHCFLFSGRLRPRETQVIKFDGITGGASFGVLNGNPDLIMVHSRCRLNISAGLYAEPRYRHRLTSMNLYGEYELQLDLRAPQTYQSAQVLLTGYRYITRDCVAASE